MSQELAPIAGENLTERKQYAETLACSGLLPAAYRGHPENVLVAVEYGAALGIQPIQAINGINVINGKPTMSADLMATMIRRAGHKLRVKGDDERAEVTIIRADDPEFVPDPIVWTMQKAKKAGLLTVGKDGRPNPSWVKYPAAMLRARAITEAARAWASDALSGVIYTPEELEQATARPVQLVADSVPEAPKGLTPAQRQAVNSAAIRAAQAGMSPDQAAQLLSEATQGAVKSTHDLTDPALVGPVCEAFTTWAQGHASHEHDNEAEEVEAVVESVTDDEAAQQELFTDNEGQTK